MDWVKSFYDRQHQLANVYTGDVDCFHRDKASTIILPNHIPPYHILELGCGGGQAAIALSELGHHVIAIDINAIAITNARKLAEACSDNPPVFIETDFYTFKPEKSFDAICYFDGFGIGTDADQQRLLQFITDWLGDGGRAFIDIYTPWYWRQSAGRKMQWSGAARQYDYDENQNRMLDTWWSTDSPDDTVTQSLRCYRPDELETLVHNINLKIVDIQPGCAYDPDTQTLQYNAPLDKAMQYLVILEKVE